MNIILFFTINSYINLQNNNINIYDKYKKVHSLSVKKRKINNIIFLHFILLIIFQKVINSGKFI